MSVESTRTNMSYWVKGNLCLDKDSQACFYATYHLRKGAELDEIITTAKDTGRQ